MILRFILVGLVAGLGLSLPTSRDLETVTRSAQNWVNTRLAEWDPQTASDPGAPVFVVELPPSLPAPAPVSVIAAPSAPLATAPRVEEAPPVAPAPSLMASLPPVIPAPAVEEAAPVVSDEVFAALLDETAASFTRDESLGATVAAAEAGTDQAELTLPEPADLVVIEPPIAPASLAAEVPDAAELPAQPLLEPSGQVALAQEPALAPAQEPEQGADSRVADDRADLAFAEALEATVAGFTQDAAALALAETERQQPRSEPIEIDGDLAPEEAYSLNRISEVVTDSRPPAQEPAPNQDRLTNAVRLTREAVIAWASLLHGPAVVTISR